MSYLVFCTFDLKSASSTDYQTAYKLLSDIGLNKIQVKSNGDKAVIPTTSVMGTFNGTSVSDVTTDVTVAVQKAFRSKNLKSEIFIMAGGDWAWNATTT